MVTDSDITKVRKRRMRTAGSANMSTSVVGKHAAEAPAEHGDGNDRAGISGDERVLRRIQELMQRNADGEDEREHFESVEGPAEVRGGERLPLRAVQRAIPGPRRLWR